MKTKPALLVVLVTCMLIALAGCSATGITPDQAKAGADALAQTVADIKSASVTVAAATTQMAQTARDQATAAKAIADQAKAAPVPDPETIAAADKNAAAAQANAASAEKVAQAVASIPARITQYVTPVVQAAQATANAATQPGSNAATVAGAGVQAVTETGILGPYSSYGALAAIGLSLVGNLIQKYQKDAATKAAASIVDAVSAGLGSGALVKTDTNAGLSADSVVTAHPIADRLIDTINAASVTAVK